MKIGLPAAVFLVFLTLKLCGVIAWSWLWVLAPLWIAFGLGLLVFVSVFVVALLVALIQGTVK